MMSFAVNYATTGDFIGAYKITNLAIHIINGLLVFAFLRLLLVAYSRLAEQQIKIRSAIFTPMVAALAASIWLLHPLNLTSVLYVVQRMTSLSAMFSLAAMICYCLGRLRLQRQENRGWLFIGAGVPICIALSILSKENGILTFPIIGLIEVCFFRLKTFKQRDRTILIAFFLLTLLLPAIFLIGSLLTNPNFILGGYAGRPFSLVERLLTEARVLWFYLSLVFLPRLNEFGLYHDDFVISTSIFHSFSTIAAVLAISFAIILALAVPKRWPLLTFAIGWYLVGHSLESSVIALEIAHEHRNYLPSVGVLFASCAGAASLFQRPAVARLSPTVAAAVIVICAMFTFLRAGDWSDPVTLAMVEAERHPESLRAVYDLARIQIGLYDLSQDPELYRQAISNLEKAALISPSAKQPLMALVRMTYKYGNTPKPEWVVELLHRFEEALFHPSETADLSLLVRCHSRGQCSFPADDVARLYHAALRNETIPKYSRATLLINLAVFYVNLAGDLEPAMALLDDAVALYPTEFNFRKTRAQVYLMAERYAMVEGEIEYMRSVNVWRDLIRPPVEVITALEDAVTKAKAHPGVEQ